MHLLASFALSALLSGGFHVPHDPATGVATCTMPSGATRIFTVGNTVVNAQYSDDLGLSWTVVDGEGLQLARGLDVVWHPHPTNPRFFIATLEGVYTYDPFSESVERLQTGWPSSDREAVSIASSLNGDGPVLAATAEGKILAWDEGSQSWSISLDTSAPDDFAQVAVSPGFDSQAGAGLDKTLLAGVAGVLYVSNDGGSTWLPHAQFTTAATAATDWTISAISFSTDFLSSGELHIGRARESTSSPTGSEGELWRSLDHGVSFNLTLATSSAIRGLHCTQPGPAPSNRRMVFATVEQFPTNNVQNALVGTLRSVNSGATWEDFGNFQDFMLDDPDRSVGQRWARYHGFTSAPDFSQSGQLFHARPEGIYRSESSGRYWRQMRLRNETFVRRMDVGLDSNGDVVAFGGTYGSGTIFARLRQNPTSGALDLVSSEVLDTCRVAYQKPCVVSPNFAIDGCVAIGGQSGLSMWFDPAKGGNNNYGGTNWVQAKRSIYGYVKAMAMSPHFNAKKNSPDQTMVWSNTNSGNGLRYASWISKDCGATSTVIDTTTSNQDMPSLNNILITNAYDASASVTRDIYCTAGNYLFHLDDTQWNPVATGNGFFSDLDQHPDFPAVPLLYALEQETGQILQFDVSNAPMGGSAVSSVVPIPSFHSQFQKMDLPDDFATSQTAYVTSSTLGAWKVTLSDPTPAWTQVGTNYPPALTWPLALSPDFANDNTIITGAREGMMVCQDDPTVSWELLRTPVSTDNQATWLSYYNPGYPGNTDPIRHWLWDRITGLDIPGGKNLDLFSLDVSYTFNNGARVFWEGYADSLEIRSFKGAMMGDMNIVVRDFWTKQVLYQATENLNTPGLPVANHLISIPSVGSWRALEVELVASLSHGLAVALDGIRANP
ncbi:MAG: hypothetical protein QGH51_10310 [Planctomycetota bacterium]|nr:hypothetical protein [Planctomycetota bacterium]